MTDHKGLFITFEGGEGSGKTSQIAILAEKLQGQGYDVVTTREPGGTPDAEKIRELLVRRDGGNWTPMAECLLFFTARNMHVETLIKPALAAGKIVLCDRFTDSTRAYQSAGHGVDIEIIDKMHEIAIGPFWPDVTFILDVDPQKGLQRSGKRLHDVQSDEDRFENLGLSFHQKLRQGYMDIASREPARCKVIDANRALNDIAADLFKQTQNILNDGVNV